MLCCVSRKASARPSNENNEKHQKALDSDCSGSSSGFSESSTASSGDFPSSGFSATSSSSSSSSGFSSASPASICAFANSSSDSSSSGFEFCDRFDVAKDYLVNPARCATEVSARGSSSSSCSPVKGFPPVPPKRLQTFAPTKSVQNRASDNGDSIVEMEKGAEDEPPVLLPCAICERTFKPESLEKHTRICERSAIKKRKPFDSAKQRIQGTELAEFLPKETVKRKVHQEEKPAPVVASKGSWKQTHDEFLKAVRAARGETNDAPPQRQVVAPSQVTVGVPTRPNEKGMCPTCNRQFSIKAYERHVAWCKEHATRVPIIPTTNVAKERLEARMKYRAPLLKNRRLTNREKYAPGSAANLSSYASKNSLGNQRAKESVSTPNCNNKGGNEATMGANVQSHQKATANSRRSGQAREGMSSGPMKSRLSDRSNRPSADIESGPTTNPSSCPIPPRINIHRHSRLSPTRAIPPSNSTSPLPTSRSVSKPESSRISSQDCGVSQKIIGTDRRSIELNIFNGAKLQQRQNIVSARSYGHPKVNDIAINDEVIGMTVQRCRNHRNDGKEAAGLITWKQISEDNNFTKQAKFLSSNVQNLEESMQKITLAESEPIVQNELNCSLKSSLDSANSANSGIKKLNKTYLIRESLDAETHLSQILDRRMRRPVISSPRTEFRNAEKTPRKNVFKDLGSDAMSPNRFNAEVNVTSSPLHGRGDDEDYSEENISRAKSPVLPGRAKLAPLDLKMIHGENSDEGDTSKSGRSTASSMLTCRSTLRKRTPKLKSISGRELICENSANLSIRGEGNFEGFEDVGLKVNSGRNNDLLDTSRTSGSIATARDSCNTSLTKNTTKTKSIKREKFDFKRQLSFRACNENTDTESIHFDEGLKDVEKNINIEESNHFLDTSRSLESKTKSWKDLDRDKLLAFRFFNEDNTETLFSKCIENVEEKIMNNEDKFLDTSRSGGRTPKDKRSLTQKKSTFREEFDVKKQLNVGSCKDKDAEANYDESIKDIAQKVKMEENNLLLGTSRSLELKTKSRKGSDSDGILAFRFHNESDARRKHCSKSIDNSKENNNEERNHPDTSQSGKSTASAKDNRSLTEKTKPTSRDIFDVKKKSSPRSCTVKGQECKLYDENNEDIEGNNQLSEASRSQLINSENRIELGGDELLNLRLRYEDNTKTKHSSKSVKNIEEKMNTEDNNELLGSSRFYENTATPTSTCRKSLKKKASKTLSSGEILLASDKNISESLDEGNYLKLIKSQHSLRDIHRKINDDEIFDSLDTSRSAASAVTAIKSCRRPSSEGAQQLLVDTELSCNKSLNYNSSNEKNEDYSVHKYMCSEVELPDEKSLNSAVGNDDQSLVEAADILTNYLEPENVKKTVIEQSKNYKRCGTYVIERAPNSNNRTKHTASDEPSEEKPILKKRKTEQDIVINKIENALISNRTSESNATGDLIDEKNLTNSQHCTSNYLVKSAKEYTESEIVSIDRGDDEIHEKYVNRNFDYDSDNTGDHNLIKDNDTEDSITTQEKLSTNDISSLDLRPIAFSDSVVTRQTNSVISSLKSQEKCVIPDSAEVKRKLKKKMSLLRGSTDTLISSVEASGTAVGENSPCEIVKTPRVEEETIQELSFEQSGKIAAARKTGCSFLPKIPVDRITAKNADAKESKFGPLDVASFWRKARRNSNTRLINLDPPKCQETRIINSRQSNVGNLPPVVPATFRKERRSGTFKDYDPFLLAERQMNELLSDTCSDQSFTDSPTDHHKSSSPTAHNYPLSHSSAFVKYPNPVTRNLNNPDKRASLIAPPSEFDDLAADFSSDSTETNSISQEILADLEDSRVRENGFGHQSRSKDTRDHVLGRRVIIDKSKALGTNEIIDDSGRKNCQTNEKARKILDKVTPKVVRPHVTRSSSVRSNSAPKAPERKNSSSTVTATNKINSRSSPGSGLNNRNNNYASLNGSNMSLSSIVSSEAEVKRSNSLFDELASSFEDDASGIYPSLRSLLKNDSLSVSSPVQSNRPRNGQISDEELSSPDSYQRHDHNKLSADSAYSSLNRKYSNHGRSTNDMAGRPEDDSPHRRRDGDAGSMSSAKSKMSKFCHECGCKFPETAKFCCECGIRRLTL